MAAARDSLEEYNYRVRRAARRKTRRQLLILCIVFLAVIFFVAFLQDTEILFVTLLYAAIFFESLCLIGVMLLSDVMWNVESLGALIRGSRAVSPSHVQRDLLSSIGIFLKYGSQGSKYSRREIALMLQDVMGKLASTRPHGNENKNAPEDLDKDLQRVVYAYLNAQEDKEVPADARRFLWIKQKATRQDREAYLASLERILQRLNNKE